MSYPDPLRDALELLRRMLRYGESDARFQASLLKIDIERYLQSVRDA